VSVIEASMGEGGASHHERLVVGKTVAAAGFTGDTSILLKLNQSMIIILAILAFRATPTKPVAV
ncbi:hypothetical protein ACJX0J_017942, partial [Zea mays]